MEEALNLSSDRLLDDDDDDVYIYMEIIGDGGYTPSRLSVCS